MMQFVSQSAWHPVGEFRRSATMLLHCGHHLV